MNSRSESSGRAGFSLIEITFALMVLSIGLLAIFHLFPSGLKASIDATADTRTATFAQQTFASIKADADEAVSDGNDSTTWESVFSGAVSIGGQTVTLSLDAWSDWTDPAVRYPAGQDEYLRYRSRTSVNGRVAGVALQVRYGKVGGYIRNFYTEIYNYGELR